MVRLRTPGNGINVARVLHAEVAERARSRLADGRPVPIRLGDQGPRRHRETSQEAHEVSVQWLVLA